MSSILKPSVWYIAAGYKLPAGIEAYLLHYATEIRNQGFDPRIIVFEPLPKVPHRFLIALRERGIPIESLYERVSPLARVLVWTTYVPWVFRRWRRLQTTGDGRQTPAGGEEFTTKSTKEEKSVSREDAKPAKGDWGEVGCGMWDVGCGGAEGNEKKSDSREARLQCYAQHCGQDAKPAKNAEGDIAGGGKESLEFASSRLRVRSIPTSFSRLVALSNHSSHITPYSSHFTLHASLLTYWFKRLAVRELKRMIERGRPDVIHVKGRLITEAWPVFPSERTIYQHALMGTRDPSWEDNEAEAFSVFLNRIAKVLVQGKGIAKTFAKAFNIKRPIEIVYTMAPDELAPEAHERSQKSEVRSQKSEVAAGDCASHIEAGGCSTTKDTKITKGEVRSQKSEGEGQGEEGRREEEEGGKVSREAAKARSEAFVSVPTEAVNPDSTFVSSRFRVRDFSAFIPGDVVSVLRFGILCRFTEQKGISYILEALKMFKEKHGAVDFTFAGQGPMEALIKASIETTDYRLQTTDVGEDGDDVGCGEGGEGIQNSESRIQNGKTRTSEEKSIEQKITKSTKEEMVISAGGGKEDASLRSSRTSVQNSFPSVRVVPVDSAVNILRELDVFVHPGLDDAMPVSIVEALMCGVPCIVSDVGASPELVREGIEGLVIQPASAVEILRAMERFDGMTAEELAGFKARARERYAAVCRPDVVGQQVAGIYRRVMSDE